MRNHVVFHFFRFWKLIQAKNSGKIHIYNEEALGLLRESTDFELLDAPLGNRKTFSNATANGMGVMEITPKDREAIDEFTTLFKYCEVAVNDIKSDMKIKN